MIGNLIIKMTVGLFLAAMVMLAGCGGGGGDTPGSASGSSALKGVWVEQSSANKVEGTIRFDELQVYRDARFGDYSMSGGILTYTLTDYFSGATTGTNGLPQLHPLSYTNVVKVSFDSTGTVMTWNAAPSGTWTPQFYPVTFKKQ